MVCSECLTSLNKNKILIELNIAEQYHISLAHAYFKMDILPYGQRAINVQVINCPYDVEEHVNQFDPKG